MTAHPRKIGKRLRVGASLEWVLATAGVICLLVAGFIWARMALVQRQVRAEITTAARAGRDVALEAAPGIAPDAAPAVTLPRASVIGLLEIPRLHLTSAVLEGDDDAVLRVAAGHLPDTPYPWQSGNATVSAHRDSIFRALEHVRVGDRISLDTKHGAFTYRVRRTFVVDPDALWVLHPDDESVGLTLLTCFPFHYIGPAPRRFVVQAERVSDAGRGPSGDVGRGL